MLQPHVSRTFLVGSILIGGLVFSSCTKNPELLEEIKGQVVTSPSGLPIPGAKVHLEKNVFTDEGTYYVTNEVIYADEHGEFTVLRSEGHEFVRAEVENFFGGQKSRVPIGINNELRIELTGMSWLKINLVNIPEANDDDIVRIWPRFLDQSPMPQMFEGADVNVELFGLIRANEVWNIRWLEIQNNQRFWHSHETAAAAGDTLTIVCAY
ncbi:MAG: hypothetical protein HKN32_07375 [Flavobacteriales bacterium]|nr:hypothetical protein [Flavobacteriales bacterium]